MLPKTLTLFTLLSLALSTPTSLLSKRQNPFILGQYTAGTFNVGPAGTPFLSSTTNGIAFYFQGDGNFVIYDGTPSASDVVYNSGTPGHTCTSISDCNLIFQGDGNLVIYVSGAAVFSTKTNGKGATLMLRSFPPYIEILDQSGNVVFQTAPLCLPGLGIPGTCAPNAPH